MSFISGTRDIFTPGKLIDALVSRVGRCSFRRRQCQRRFLSSPAQKNLPGQREGSRKISLTWFSLGPLPPAACVVARVRDVFLAAHLAATRTPTPGCTVHQPGEMFVWVEASGATIII